MLLQDGPCEGTAGAKAGQQERAEHLETGNSGAGALMWGWGKALLEQDGTREAHRVHTVEGLPSLLRDLHSI